MPRFLSPFRSRERETQPVYLDTSSTSRSDPYQYDSPSAGSRWRNLFGRRGPQKNVIYTNDLSYMPHVRHNPSVMPSGRRRGMEDYSDANYTDLDIRDRYSRRGSGAHYLPSEVMSQGSFVEEPVPVPFVDGTTALDESVYSQEPVLPPIDEVPLTSAPPVATLDGGFAEGAPGSYPFPTEIDSIPDTPMVQEGHRRSRVHERRAESIPRGSNIRIQSNRTGGRGYYRDRRDSMNTLSTGSYTSDDGGGYTTGSSRSDVPIIISADRNAAIEIGNDRDGYIPYQEYLADRNSRRHNRRQHHRRHRLSEEEEDEEDRTAQVRYQAQDHFRIEVNRTLTESESLMSDPREEEGIPEFKPHDKRMGPT
ncbi:hypothetical protein BU17DRAFT_92109 [Hysterangium stoloniferum]|nr:hypothetical protein BU17DRAFT_92109 [Hysterangium stoloniferum]